MPSYFAQTLKAANGMEHSDEYLLRLALNGDGSCFGQLVTRWELKIFGFICRYVGNREEAKDLTQETFSKAYQNMGRLSDPNRFKPWLYKIALNECRMRFRRERGFTAAPLETYLESPGADLDTVTPEEVLSKKEAVEVLKVAFTRLPEDQKTVILMKEYQGLKFHEIADTLDVPLSTVKSRMYLGLKTLRKLMEKDL